MTALEIKEIKHDLIRSILEVNDVDVLGRVRDYLIDVQENTTPEPPSKSIEEINQLIEIADKEEGFDHEHFKKYYNL